MQDVLFLYDVGVVLVFVFIVVVGDLCHFSVEKKKKPFEDVTWGPGKL